MSRWSALILSLAVLSCQKLPAAPAPEVAAQSAVGPATTAEKSAEIGAIPVPASQTEGRALRRSIEVAPPPEPPPRAAAPVLSPATRLPASTVLPESSPPVAEIRPAVLAGSWYEESPQALAAQVDALLAGASGEVKGYPMALIAPHAGYRFSGALAGKAYATLKGRTYRRVFVLGPGHRSALAGIAFPAHTRAFQTPLGEVPLALEVLDQLRRNPLFRDHPAAHRHEHSIEIQLPFLQRVLGPDFELVPMVVGVLNRQQLGEAAAALQAVIRPGDLVVASSDFTHFGERFNYEGPPGDPIPKAAREMGLQALLDAAWTAIADKDADALLAHKVKTRDTICGLLPIALMLRVLPHEVDVHLLGRDLSGRMTGSFDESVSYLSAAFTGLWPYQGVSGADGLSAEEQDTLLKLARRQVEMSVREEGKVGTLEADIDLTPRLRQPGGAFVTLKMDGQLRGCIGTILPDQPLHQAVLKNAVNAARFDRRFPPVSPQELASIQVEVSVLTPPVPIEDWHQIILAQDGVILKSSGKSAVFLPQVAPEQGWTLEETLSHLALKAGLGKDDWREGAHFQVFQAIVFHEGP